MLATVVLVVGLAALAGCGGGERQDADEPSGDYTVDVVRATFPKDQALAEKARMTITVRNAGDEKVPNVAVTITPTGQGVESDGITAFGYRTSQPGVSDANRPLWVLDHGPATVLPEGQGGATTAYLNTWALGELAAGETKTFTWDVVPVKAGTHKVLWRVAAGLDGKAVAKLPDGNVPEGSFTVDVSGEPAQTKVAANGEVVPQ